MKIGGLAFFVAETKRNGGLPMNTDEIFMKKAIELSAVAVEHGNEPFGAVLVKDRKIV